jgi:hypothetical protein
VSISILGSKCYNHDKSVVHQSGNCLQIFLSLFGVFELKEGIKKGTIKKGTNGQGIQPG